MARGWAVLAYILLFFAEYFSGAFKGGDNIGRILVIEFKEEVVAFDEVASDR